MKLTRDSSEYGCKLTRSRRTSEWLSVVICTVFTEPKRNPGERKANRVIKMIPIHRESSRIKERNSCVYFAEVRNEPNRTAPCPSSAHGRTAVPETTRSCTSRCNLCPSTHGCRLRQSHPVVIKQQASFLKFPSLVRLWSSRRPNARAAASEGGALEKQQGENRRASSSHLKRRRGFLEPSPCP